jgi:hypothetical protein
MDMFLNIMANGTFPPVCTITATEDHAQSSTMIMITPQASLPLKTYLGTTFFKITSEHFHQLGAIDPTFAAGQQEDSFSKYPYTPIGLDSRFGMPTNTPLNESNSFDSSESSQIGNVTSGKAFSASFLNHDVALRALDRLAAQDKPFLLTVSYHHPIRHSWLPLSTSPIIGTTEINYLHLQTLARS